MIRDEIIAEARSWIGTPYKHLAGAYPVKGVACDCVGVLRAVYDTVTGRALKVPMGYSQDWAEAGGEEIFLDGARAQLNEIPIVQAKAGDLLVFRWQPGVPAKHCAIIVSDDPARIVHAYDAARKVAEVNLAPQWRVRIAAAFAFPES